LLAKGDFGFRIRQRSARKRGVEKRSFLESFVQVPLSAVLIFLGLLAVKNRFKIK